MLAGVILGLELPQSDKRLLVIVEADGCFSDGIAVTTNCWVGHRTMRVEDYGKVAATFVDTHDGRAIRLFPHPEARQQAAGYAPEAINPWQAYLLGYQRMPDELLLSRQDVRLRLSVEEIISRPGVRVQCDSCGEEVLNEREVYRDGRPLCRACAGQSYYDVTPPSP